MGSSLRKNIGITKTLREEGDLHIHDVVGLVATGLVLVITAVDIFRILSRTVESISSLFVALGSFFDRK